MTAIKLHYKLFFHPIFIVFLFCTAASCTYLLYLPAVNTNFIFDDYPNIRSNQYIFVSDLTWDELRDAAFKSPNITRPVANISFALNYFFSRGANVHDFRTVNILIHLINGFLLFFLLHSTLSLVYPEEEKTNRMFSFCAAAIWLVHPVHIQSVVYIVQRMNSMAAMFYLASLLAYTRGRLAKGRFSVYFLFFVSFLFGFLAIGSKENAATLPFFILLYEWFFFQNLGMGFFRKNTWQIFFVLILFIAIGGGFLLSDMGIRTWELLNRGEFTVYERVLTQFRVIMYYISILAVPDPSRLCLDYSYPLSTGLLSPLTTIISMCAVVLAVIYACYKPGKHLLVSFGIFWFFGNLAIESSFLPLALIFEHRTYLPSAFALAALAVIVFRSIPKNTIHIIVFSGLFLILGIWTLERNLIWGNPEALWKDTMEKNPENPRAIDNYAAALLGRGETDKAIQLLEKAMEIKKNEPWIYYHFAKAYYIKEEYKKAMKYLYFLDKLEFDKDLVYALYARSYKGLGNLETAEKYYEKSLSYNPKQFELYNNLGNIYLDRKKYEKAVEQFQKALYYQKDYAKAHLNLGIAYSFLNQYEKAYANIQKAVELRPEYALSRYNLGYLEEKQGNLEKALADYQKALQLDPQTTEAKERLGLVMGKIKYFNINMQKIEKALKTEPNNPVLYYQAGVVHQKVNKREKAESYFKKAISLKPDMISPKSALAGLYAGMQEYEKAYQAFKDILEYRPDLAPVYYNMAAMRAKDNRVDEALGLLETAVKKGYTRCDKMEKDPDLSSLAAHPGFGDILTLCRKQQQEKEPEDPQENQGLSE